jgi:hypothetical protein
MNLHRTWKILGAGALALSAAAVIAAPPTLGKNLIKNPGAEAGPGAVDRVGIVAPPQWTITGNVTAAAYGSPGMPNDSTPGPPKRGENFFAGGPLNALSKLEQRINVKALADQINTGNIGYSLAAGSTRTTTLPSRSISPMPMAWRWAAATGWKLSWPALVEISPAS